MLRLIDRFSWLLIILLTVGAFFVNSMAFYIRVRFTVMSVFSELTIIALLGLLVRATTQNTRLEDLSLTQKLRLSLLVVLVIYIVGFSAVALAQPEFMTPRYSGTTALKPNSWSAVLVSNAIGVAALISLTTCLAIVRSLILYRRKKNTARNFYLFVLFGSLTVISSAISGKPLKLALTYNHPVTTILMSLTLIFLAANIVRTAWITVLNRKQKFLTFIGGLVFVFVTAGLHGTEVGSGVTLSDMVNSYSLIAGSFLFLVTIFLFLYSTTATVNALFHLPTAAIYDKKVREINSIYSLSRTINSLFDFNKIVSSVTELVCETTNAQACWLEMAREKPCTARTSFSFTAMKTRENFHIHFLEVSFRKYLAPDRVSRQIPSTDRDYREYLIQPVRWVLENKKPLVVNQVKKDKLTKDLVKTPVESLVIVPLISYDEIAGLVFAVKSTPFGFDQDDVAVISAFANQATVAIENTRLVTESLEKERMAEELRIAHEVQMKLIPQIVPVVQNEARTARLEVGAATVPANEVGGDYYDFVTLSDGRTGIVVADVSGKGTSAAFYMAEIKGIIQSLASIYSTPSTLLTAVNNVLYRTMDRKSFITLVYVDFDIEKNELRYARAGHCPILCIHAGQAQYLCPNGIGLGLDGGPIFETMIQDQAMKVQDGDIFVLYSDGLLEARNSRGEEYGEERLSHVVLRSADRHAEDITNSILNDVRSFVGLARAHDDLTCVVLKLCMAPRVTDKMPEHPGMTKEHDELGSISGAKS